MEPLTPSAKGPEPDWNTDCPSRREGSRSAERALVGFFLVVLVSPLLIQTIVEVHRGEGLSAWGVIRQTPTSAHLRAFERQLDDASVVAPVLRPWMQFVQFAWLGDGGEKTLVGHGGWLFYRPGFDDRVARGGDVLPATNDPVAAVVTFRDALAARGVQLLVVPAPNKESIYPDRLTRRVRVGQTMPSAAARNVMERITAAGVECVDLFAVFARERAAASTPLYLAQDSHWSPAGVELAAKAVARRVLELGWARPGSVVYQERPAPVERLGDLLRMSQSTRIERSTAPERVPAVQVVEAGTGRRYADSPDAEILVLGDSFLRIYEQDEPQAGGFVALMAKELRQPLTSLVSDGGASTLVRQELYRRPGLLHKKRVVIWEFVERDLRLGAEGWQQIPLPPPTPRGAAEGGGR